MEFVTAFQEALQSQPHIMGEKNVLHDFCQTQSIIFNNNSISFLFLFFFPLHGNNISIIPSTKSQNVNTNVFVTNHARQKYQDEI